MRVDEDDFVFNLNDYETARDDDFYYRPLLGERVHLMYDGVYCICILVSELCHHLRRKTIGFKSVQTQHKVVVLPSPTLRLSVILGLISVSIGFSVRVLGHLPYEIAYAR